MTWLIHKGDFYWIYLTMLWVWGHMIQWARRVVSSTMAGMWRNLAELHLWNVYEYHEDKVMDITSLRHSSRWWFHSSSCTRSLFYFEHKHQFHPSSRHRHSHGLPVSAYLCEKKRIFITALANSPIGFLFLSKSVPMLSFRQIRGDQYVINRVEWCLSFEALYEVFSKMMPGNWGA